MSSFIREILHRTTPCLLKCVKQPCMVSFRVKKSRGGEGNMGKRRVEEVREMDERKERRREGREMER